MEQSKNKPVTLEDSWKIMSLIDSIIDESAQSVKRTCGYLGNPQARPMVHGRHKEISYRVKHMNGSAL